jgi:hypothetical protein
MNNPLSVLFNSDITEAKGTSSFRYHPFYFPKIGNCPEAVPYLEVHAIVRTPRPIHFHPSRHPSFLQRTRLRKRYTTGNHVTRRVRIFRYSSELSANNRDMFLHHRERVSSASDPLEISHLLIR